MFFLRYNILFIICIFAVAHIHAREPHPAGLNLSETSYWVDEPDTSLSWYEVLEEATWEPINEELNFGYRNQPIWIKQDLKTYIDGLWLHQITYPLLDKVDIYFILDGQVQKQVMTGDSRDFSSRDYDVPEFVTEFTSDDSSQWMLLMRIETSGTLILPMKWWQEDKYRSSQLNQHALYGGYYSVLLAMIFYNLFIYLTIREKSYLYYVLSVSTLAILQLTFDGRGFQWLWPNHPIINQFSFPVAYNLYQIAIFSFMMEFLSTKKYAINFHRILYALRAAAAINLILLFFIPYKLMTPIIVLIGLTGILTGIASGTYLWKKGYTAARFFTIAWGVYLVGIVVLNLRGLGVINSHSWVDYLYIVGSIFEVLLLSFSLAERISTAQKEKRQAEKSFIQAQSDSLNNLKRFQDLYENSPVGNFQADMNYKFISLNTVFSNIFGFSTSEIAEQEINDIRDFLLTPYHEFRELILETKKYSSISGRDLKIKDKDGEHHWVLLSMRVVGNVEGVAFEGSIVDVTKRKKSELKNKLMEKERLHILEQFSLGISNEINPSLGSNVATAGLVRESIQDYIDEMELGYEIDLKRNNNFFKLVEQSLGLIEGNQKHMVMLVKRFREVSSNHLNMTRKYFKIDDVITSVIESMKHKLAGWAVDISCANSITLQSYPKAIHIIFEELINNSISYGVDNKGNNPTIKISVVLEKNDQLLVEFSDNGVGVKEELLDKLWQPFYTSKRGPGGHVGLGLYMVYNLINRTLQGKFTLRSNESSGLVVILCIPLEI